MTRPAVLALVLGAAVVGPLAAAAPASAATGTSTVRVAAAEWYRPSPACATPTGCSPAAPPSPYSEGTLHVGVVAGEEESRTYLRLDASTLPAGADVTGGRLRIALATGPQDGTYAPETAKVRACLVLGQVQGDADGSLDAPPGVDCGVQAPAAVVPATATTPPALTVDLAPFGAEWAGASTVGALALLPAQDAAPTDSWHVAFSEADGVAATLAWSTPGSAAPPPAAPPPFVPPADDTGFASTPIGQGVVTVEPALPDAGVPPVSGPEVAPPDAQSPVVEQNVVSAAATVPGAGFAYPAVFLLPLALAGIGGVIARAMTRDLVRDDLQGGRGAL